MIPQTTQCYNSTHLYKMHNIYLSPSCIKCGRVGGDYEISLVRNETQHFGASGCAGELYDFETVGHFWACLMVQQHVCFICWGQPPF